MKTMFTKFAARSALLIACGFLALSAMADTEPNNSIDEANLLDLDTEVSGTLAIDEGDFNDYYQLEMPANGDVTITADYGDGLSGFIYLYNSSGAQLGFASSSTGTLIVSCVHSGTVYARASRTSGSGNYTLSVSLDQPVNENDAEPNNSLAEIQAAYVENQEFSGQVGYFNSPSGDSEDWYYLLSPRDGNVTLTATYDDGLSGFIYLYEKDGTQINFSSVAGETASVTAFCYAEDTLVARITRSAGCGSYTASFETSVLQNTNDLEPNNGLVQVQNYYEENEEFTGHIGYVDADFGTDGEDWFGLLSPRDGNVTLTATYDEPLSGFIYLYEKDGTQISFSSVSGNTASVTAFCYAADTLIARITRSAGCGSYSASFETSTLDNENDLESNNSLLETQLYLTEGEAFTGHLGYIDADFGADGNDWFGLITEQNGDVTLNVTYDEPLNGFIYLYRKGGAQIGFSSINGTSASFTAFCIAADTIYARISRSAGCGSYSASFEMSPNLYENDVEPNNTIDNALAFDPDNFNEGQVGYFDDDIGTDSDDYYEILVESAPFELEINLVKSTVFGGFLYLYNSAGGQITFVSHGGTINTTLEQTINTAGTYYIRVNRTSSCGSYSLFGPNLSLPVESDPIACSDGIDNDGDGLIDCEDPQCQVLSNNVGCTTCFEDGLSFADEVIEYENNCSNNIATDPTQALGVPDYAGDLEHVTLGAGFIKLGFTNNTLINSGNEDPDLFVFEVGPAVEGSAIELRPLNSTTEDILIANNILDSDGDGFYEFGTIGGSTASVDIDSFFDGLEANSLQFDAIKIFDFQGGCGGATPGPDIDAVCALSSLPCSIGAPCDDGDEMTENDVFNNNCECEGTPIVFECPDLSADIGDSCDDDDSTTTDDTVTADCECEGTSIFDCPDLEANNGDACETQDGLEGTLVDCNCIADEIPGCTSESACNYNPDATVDDDSCIEPVENCSECDDNGDLVPIDSDGDGICDADEIEGCTSETACNYNPNATDDDETCIEPVENCSECDGEELVPVDSDNDGLCDADDPCPLLADLQNGDDCITNGGQSGTVADCNCILDIIPGCTSETACNYNPDATVDDDTCIEPIADCLLCDGEGGTVDVDTDGDGVCDADDPCPELPGLENGDTCTNDDGDAGTVIDCNCIADPVPGCTSVTACNYNPDATVDDDTCIEPIEDCLECDGEGGTVDVDSDGDGICDADDPCPGLAGLENGDTCTNNDGDAGTVENCTCVADPIEIPGCTNILACNYNPEANTDDGSCFFNGDFCELEDGSTGEYSGCECVPTVPSDCENYVYYLSNTLSDGTTNIYEVELDGNEAQLALIGTSEYEVAIAYDEVSGLIYAVSKQDGSYRVFDPVTGIFGPVESLSDDLHQIVGATFNTDGKLMMLSQLKNAVFSIDLATNNVSVFDSYSPVLGGDIDLSSDGALYLATREGFGTLYLSIPDQVGPDILVGDAPQFVTGIADTENGNFILSHSNSSTLVVREYNGDQSSPYNLTLDGEPFETLFGDLASGCASAIIDECLDVGECYATSAEYVEGTLSDGGQISPNRADPNQALGEPEFVDELVFTSLGFGGSLTFQFDGAVINDEGPDLQIVEVSFGNPGCESFPEYADVSVSEDGEDFYYIGTVCKSNPFVDISEAETEEPLNCVYYVRVENNDELSTQAGDGFDVDGIIALHNCDQNAAKSIVSNNAPAEKAILTAYPNPTNGPSVAVFVTGQTERATLEVYDMNGRLVEGLFSGIAEEGVEYRLDFDGLRLPNGVYMYRLTTESETIVEKFMIAK